LTKHFFHAINQQLVLLLKLNKNFKLTYSIFQFKDFSINYDLCW